VNYWAVTGGVGPYANDRGEIKVVNNKNGTSVATVTLCRTLESIGSAPWTSRGATWSLSACLSPPDAWGLA